MPCNPQKGKVEKPLKLAWLDALLKSHKIQHHESTIKLSTFPQISHPALKSRCDAINLGFPANMLTME